MSVTIQPTNFPAVPPVPVLVLVLLDGELAEAQPAASSRLALASATAMIDLFNCDLLDVGSTDAALAAAGSTRTPAGPGTNVTPPTGIARRLALPAKTRKAVRDLPVMLMPN